ncbi:MAG: thioredoxin domain-containing protein [Ignavibacteriales bacterium]|nr:thioredoxin domain-containing protein [Ignavibacteriales bacterium]
MNRLSREKSPYLLQHKDNPVDWFPWGEEAFAKAKTENKPIFLSIGYSTCHWCHVMERESFENKTTAELMNKYFVNIKVDREERPDVDKVYMTAVQTMAGQGGWPLSVFLAPDLKPFYGGTYFPPKDGYGRPGFPTLLERIHEVWQNERENVVHSSQELTNSLQHRHYIESKNTEIDETILKRTYHQIAAGYDPKFAGFGAGPKFPRPVVFNFLFRYYYRTKDQEALRMSLTTLMAMASGGMYDHLGGGFHRYSVDGQWRVPHFEKMLYDQAQLVHSYLDAYQITHDEFFATIAKETLDYVLRDLTSKEGGFYSAEDADSTDNENPDHTSEGAFYIWKKSEIDGMLTSDESKVFCHHFSVEESGNALSDPHNDFIRKNILFAPFTVEQTAQFASMSVEKVKMLLERSREKLFAARNQRPRPHLDDKILTAWNGLMIGAFARAGLVFANDKYRKAALDAAEFIRSHMYDEEKQLLSRRYRDGEVKFEAHLDDYTFLISGLIDLYESTFDLRWLQWADELMGKTITLFWDSSESGFFDTSGKDASILVRMKETYDGAEATGNAVAVMDLIRLYHRTNNESYKNYAQSSLQYYSTLLAQSPQIMPHGMAAVEYFLSSPEHLILVSTDNKSTAPFLSIVSKNFLPNLNIIELQRGTSQYFVQKFPFMQEMLKTTKVSAYYCTQYTCQLPTNDPEEIERQLLSKVR